MSDQVRLDPATLRELERLFNQEALLSRMGALEVGKGIGFAEAAERCRGLAAEAEACPPLLSDWVRAAEVSALGRDSDPAHPLLTEVHLRWVDGLGMCVHTVEVGPGGSLVFIRGELVEGCQTPAELTAALDRLAEEVER